MTQRCGRLAGLLKKLEFDRAVALGLASRAWQFIAGPITTILVASFFSREVQGYFYTFASLLALQTFVELGLHTIIIYLTSHEWAHLKLDENGQLAGRSSADDPAIHQSTALSRLISFGQKLFQLYAIAACAFLVVVGAAGYWFFSQDNSAVNWIGPWFCFVTISSVSLFLIPHIGMLEGCDQVAAVNRMRLSQAVFGNIAVWSCLVLGGDLWTAVAGAGVKCLAEVFFVFGCYRRFFQSFKQEPKNSTTDWRKEVWPLQWRAALQSMSNYFSFPLIVPVVFQFHGAAMAGRVGMTWTILMAIQGAAGAWLQAKIPTLGVLIAQGRRAELAAMFRKLTLICVGVVAVGVGCFVVGIELLHVAKQHVNDWRWMPEFGHKLISKLPERLLDWLPVLLLGTALTVNQFLTCCGAYIRAHKQDPLLLTICGSNFAIGLGIFTLVPEYSATGASAVCLGVLALVSTPAYLYFMSQLQGEPDSDNTPAN